MAILAKLRKAARAIAPLLLALVFLASTAESQTEGARFEDGTLILEEITIQGELRTPQAIFLILKSTPNLSNVLLERSFLEDVVSPIYPGAFSSEPTFMSARRIQNLPWWVRYGSIAALGGTSAYMYTSDNSEEGLVFGVIAGLGLLGNLILDLGGQ